MAGGRWTMPNWLTFSLVALLAALNGLQLWLGDRERTRLLRMFCEKQGIPWTSMEGAREEKPATPPRPPTKRLTIPVPLGWRPPSGVRVPAMTAPAKENQ
jgi:hypothetical protein